MTDNVADLDRLAWDAIRGWPTVSGHLLSDSNKEYAELTRWFLWDKVGRSIRIRTGSSSSIFEKEQTRGSESSATCLVTPGFVEQLRRQLHMVLMRIRRRQALDAQPQLQQRDGRLILVPYLSDRLQVPVRALIRDNICRVAVRQATESIAGTDIFQPLESCPDHGIAVSVHGAITKGLAAFGITLLPDDASTLFSQLMQLSAQVTAAEKELSILKPDAVLVHGDNHPPFQAYVFAAQKMGIPSIMLQHGLDCEHLYLDEAYASSIAVWGQERLRRYRQHSIRQPVINVIGNPGYDHLQLPDRIKTFGQYWLWATRPHTPEKCYPPSRNPEEGLQIFDAIVEALRKQPQARLIIKPHPFDYSDLYNRLIVEAGLQKRVEVRMGSIGQLFDDASLVITEDSSAGLDAMLAGKLLVHVHFAKSKPAMPFVEYGAALPGFCRDELIASLEQLTHLSNTDAQCFINSQRHFIEDFAGPCDGAACDRFVRFVEQVWHT